MNENTVVRISTNREIKKAVAVLASMGLTLSNAFRIMLTHVSS